MFLCMCFLLILFKYTVALFFKSIHVSKKSIMSEGKGVSVSILA
jgi:hypothetical protein